MDIRSNEYLEEYLITFETTVTLLKFNSQIRENVIDRLWQKLLYISSQALPKTFYIIGNNSITSRNSVDNSIDNPYLLIFTEYRIQLTERHRIK